MWLGRWKKHLRQASRASLVFSLAGTIVLYVSRYLGDHVSNWFAVLLMLGYMISIPAITVTTVLWVPPSLGGATTLLPYLLSS